MTLSVSSEQHLRLVELWHELGKIVAQEDNTARAKVGYERYVLSLVRNGELTAGDCPWEELDEAGRRHWVAAFTE